jgi:hypothetical protein
MDEPLAQVTARWREPDPAGVPQLTVPGADRAADGCPHSRANHCRCGSPRAGSPSGRWSPVRMSPMPWSVCSPSGPPTSEPIPAPQRGLGRVGIRSVAGPDTDVWGAKRVPDEESDFIPHVSL